MPPRFNRTQTFLAVALIAASVGIVAGVRYAATRPWESPIERAHRLCGGCGLDAAEVDWLIDTMRAAGAKVGRQALLDGFYDTFQLGADAELCEPCAEAVLDAPGREQAYPRAP